MSFAAMSPAIVAAGAAAIAILLFALQRLRVRRRVVRIASAPLWAAAMRAAPPRTLGGRFRRPLAYMLLLTIAWLLWLAAARPEPRSPADGRYHLYYLDASAPMLPAGRFAAARPTLIRDVATVPRAEREVDLGDADGTRLLDAGEEAEVLAGRLAAVRPQAIPPGFGDWLETALAPFGRKRPITVHYYGSEPAMAGLAGRLPPNVRLVAGYLAPPLSFNRGIVALGVSPAASGRWETADVLVRLADSRGRSVSADAMRFELDGKPFSPRTIQAAEPGSFLLRDVAAAGGTLRVMLSEGDGFTADDAAAIVLPDRRPVRVAIAPGTPAAIRAVIARDPALRQTGPADAMVVVRWAGETFGNDLPALLLTPPERQAATFAIIAPDGDDPGAPARAMAALGMAGLDPVRLANGIGRPIAVTVAGGRRRGLSVWPELFADGGGFAQSRAMPLFVSQALRWLARPAPWIPFAQAGGALVDQSALYGLAGDDMIERRRLNDAVILAQAGREPIGDRIVQVALDAPALTRAVATPAAGTPIARSGSRLPDRPFSALLLAAGLLLAIEWRLLLRRAIP